MCKSTSSALFEEKLKVRTFICAPIARKTSSSVTPAALALVYCLLVGELGTRKQRSSNKQPPLQAALMAFIISSFNWVDHAMAALRKQTPSERLRENASSSLRWHRHTTLQERCVRRQSSLRWHRHTTLQERCVRLISTLREPLILKNTFTASVKSGVCADVFLVRQAQRRGWGLLAGSPGWWRCHWHS